MYLFKKNPYFTGKYIWGNIIDAINALRTGIDTFILHSHSNVMKCKYAINKLFWLTFVSV